jgi:GH25 family lysozyme M1 (1,4-beta-N-acetylmuramidase)
MMRTSYVLVVVAACANAPAVSSVEENTTVCGSGPTVKGMDVSYYQGTIDWNAVAADGVVYAFIRTSDGSFHDPQFDNYWAQSRAAGVKHGAYHFFRPESDPIAQADYLLGKIGGKLEADDLPPVLDVEAADGIAAANIASGIQQWSDHVEAAIGRKPIIYTGMYFWQDSVGNASMPQNPLWHAQYTSASCPSIASSWSDWTFWQYTSTGSVGGISGGVDVDRFNGDATAFQGFLGPPGPAAPCGTIDAAGGMIDNGDACYVAGGPAAGIRHVATSGMDQNLDWTHTTANATEQNYAEWTLNFAEAGNYEVQVYTAAAFAQSKQAKYVVTAADGPHDVVIDQTAVDGWQSLGTFAFAMGGSQSVHVGDNTGEPEANNVQLVFDAVQLVRDDGQGSGSGSGSGSGDGSGSGSGSGDGTTPPAPGGGCSTGGGLGGSAGGGLVVMLGLVLRRRRR